MTIVFIYNKTVTKGEKFCFCFTNDHLSFIRRRCLYFFSAGGNALAFLALRILLIPKAANIVEYVKMTHCNVKMNWNYNPGKQAE